MSDPSGRDVKASDSRVLDRKEINLLGKIVMEGQIQDSVRICGAEDAEHGRRSKDGGPGEEKKLKRTGGRTSRFLFSCPRIIFGTLRSM